VLRLAPAAVTELLQPLADARDAVCDDANVPESGVTIQGIPWSLMGLVRSGDHVSMSPATLMVAVAVDSLIVTL
jgi:hypothetical protein